MSDSQYQCHCWNNLEGDLSYVKFKSYSGDTVFDEIDIFINDDHHLNLPQATGNLVKVEDDGSGMAGFDFTGCIQVNSGDRVKIDVFVSNKVSPPPPPCAVYVNDQLVTGIPCP